MRPHVLKAEARAEGRADRLPGLVRPSYVLGGRAMEIVHDENELETYMKKRRSSQVPNHPVLIDSYLQNASRARCRCSL